MEAIAGQQLCSSSDEDKKQDKDLPSSSTPPQDTLIPPVPPLSLYSPHPDSEEELPEYIHPKLLSLQYKCAAVTKLKKRERHSLPLDYDLELGEFGYGAERMASSNAWPHAGWNPRMSMSLSSTKGLLNAPGENNCFLNSAVQVLWHLDVFRRSFRMLSGHACMGNSCIFCALKVIFTQFQFSDRSALPPDALRKALAKTFADQQRFQLGLMDDAAECFENILMRIHFHLAHPESEDLCRAPHCIPHQKFAMTVVEQMVCECGATSEPLTFTQMVHYVSTSSLVTQLRRLQSNSVPNFGHMLRMAMSDGGEVRNCPGNCGRRVVQVRRTLTNTPEVVSVGLIWDSDHPSLDHIKEVLRSIGTTLNLAQVFHSVVDKRRAEASSLHLVGVVCYYGKHYSTFLFNSKMKTWVSFDDATVKELDPYWETVVDKCGKGHYQPLLLLFADPNSVPVPTETAHAKTYLLDKSQYFGNDDSGVSQNGNHRRQRSIDRLSDGSGTVGGRGMPYYIDKETSLNAEPAPDNSNPVRRAVTPNPMKAVDKAPAGPGVMRRAITPNPEWGRYNSDDEEEDKKRGDVVHFRQPSYLHALDTGSRPEHSSDPFRRATAPRDAYPQPSAPQQPPQRNPSDYQPYNGTNNSGLQARNAPRYASNTNPSMGLEEGAVAIDLLGPIPKASHVSANDYNKVYPNNPMNSRPEWGNSTVQNQYAHHQQQPQHLAQPSQNTYPANTNFVNPASVTSRSSSMAKVNEIQKTNPPGILKNSQSWTGKPYNGTVPQDQRQVEPRPLDSQHRVRTHSLGQELDVEPTSKEMDYPSLKRTKSVENTAELGCGEVSSQGPQRSCGVSRSRPHSARPFDYGGGRPTVDPNTGAVYMPKKEQPAMKAAYSSGNLTQAARDMQDISASGEKTNKTNRSSQWSNNEAETDNYGTYISRKTVQNILQHQGVKNKPASGQQYPNEYPHDASIPNPHAKPIIKKSWSQNEQLMKDLRVDIPDNSSLNSNQESGYRSGSSGGDRNSASSTTSSLSSESPNNMEGSKPVRQDHFPSAKPAHHRLGQIPENISLAHKQQAPLPGQAQVTTSKPTVPAKPQLSQPPNTKPANTPGGSNTEKLYMEAESLMELSNQRQEKGDLPMALLHCNKAIGLLQQALGMPGASQESLVRVRMKHNSCVLRSRRLHKQLTTTQRQSSNQSTISSDMGIEADRLSVSSSTSTDTDGPKDPFSLPEDNQPKSLNLMGFPEEKQDYQILQDKVSKLYAKQDSGYHGYESGSHSNQEFQYNVRQATQEYKARNAQQQGQYWNDSDSKNIPKPSIPHSLTDSQLSQRNRRDSIDRLSQGSMDSVDSSDRMSRTRMSNQAPPATTDQTGKGIAHYVTLPRKSKQAKPQPNPSQEAEVYQAYLQRQRSYDETKDEVKPSIQTDSDHKPKEHQGLLVNHARQWSKEEIRKLLVKDYYDRSGKGQHSQEPSFEKISDPKGNSMEPFQLQRKPRSRENSIDACSEESFPPPPPPIAQPEPTEVKPPVLSRAHGQTGRPMPSGLNPSSYEDMINKQLRQMAVKERAREPGAPEGPAFQIKEKSHYAYRHQINLPPRPKDMNEQQYSESSRSQQQQGPSGPVRVMPQTHPDHGPPAIPAKTYSDRTQAPLHMDTQGPHQQDASYFVGLRKEPIRKCVSHNQLSAHTEALDLGREAWVPANAPPPPPPPDTSHQSEAPHSSSSSTALGLSEPVTGSRSSSLEQEAPPPPPPPLPPSTSEAVQAPEETPSPVKPIFAEDDLPPPPYPGPPPEPIMDPHLIVPSTPKKEEMVQEIRHLSHSQSAPQGLSGQVQDIVVQPVWTGTSKCNCRRNSLDTAPSDTHPKLPPKPCRKCKVSRKSSNSSTSSWGTDLGSVSSSSSNKPKVPPKLRTFQQVDSGISSGSCSNQAPDSPTTSPSRAHKHHTKHKSRSRGSSPKSKPHIHKTSDPKPALCKKKKKGRRKKSVTFSESVALISTGEDKPEPVDYIKYVIDTFHKRKDRLHSLSSSTSSLTSSLDSDALSHSARSEGESSRSSTDLSGSRSSGQGQGYDSDLEVNSGSEDEEDSDAEEQQNTDIVNKMRCNLCRRKWVDRDAQYCVACGAYMAKLQPSTAS